MSLDTLLEAAQYIEQQEILWQELRHRREEEPSSPVSASLVGGALSISLPPRPNGVVVAPVPLAAAPLHLPIAAAPQLHTTDLFFEHSRSHSSNSHGPSVPSPPTCTRDTSNTSGGGGGVRAGTREVHNKLEKNRRAHLKECFELLKRQLPATNDDKKASNLSILGSANRYIQVLRRKERECEHEMERLAREKIAAQQRLAALKREVLIRSPHAQRPPAEAPPAEDRERTDRVNGRLLGIPISITSAGSVRVSTPPSVTSQVTGATELRTLPVQVNTSQQNGQTGDNGLSPSLGTALVHPAHLHLPLSQVVRSGLVVGGAALQLVSGATGALRVLHTSHLTNQGRPGATGGTTARLPVENGVITSTPSTDTSGGVVVSGLGPLVVSQEQAQLLHAHSLTHKGLTSKCTLLGVSESRVGPIVSRTCSSRRRPTPLAPKRLAGCINAKLGTVLETQVVSAQYLGATLVNPLVVVSSAPAPAAAPPPTTSAAPASTATSQHV